jgi:hypothetical protein
VAARTKGYGENKTTSGIYIHFVKLCPTSQKVLFKRAITPHAPKENRTKIRDQTKNVFVAFAKNKRLLKYLFRETAYDIFMKI